jgi:2-iminoacetate synthase
VSFLSEIDQWPRERLQRLVTEADANGVERALSHEDRTIEDFAALISPHARPRLEAMAREAQRLTRWHFGRTVSLYAPIYISNLCVADCTYCGYAVRSANKERRITLKEDQIRKECESLASHGFQSVLLLTGEAPKQVKVEYIARSVEIAREFFSSVSVEVYVLEDAGYRQLVDAGLEGVTIYMETYDRETYRKVHLQGQKMDYLFRLDGLERAGRAGVRKLSLGALLGLHNWRHEAVLAALHAKHLQKQCWQSSVSISFPRLRHTPTRFNIPELITDAEFVQLMLAMRLFLPEVGFNLSTREEAGFRDRLIPLGITSMSAGSSTRPGGYSLTGDETLEQFEIEDTRSVPEVVDAIRRAGYDPVWKDFDPAFVDKV